MKILEKTSTHLKLRHRPLLIWILTGSIGIGIPLSILCIGLIATWIFYLWWLPLFITTCILFGLLTIAFAGEVITCSFDKNKDRVIIQQQSLFKTKRVEHYLSDVVDVQVQQTSWYASDNATYQIVLILRMDQSLPLNLSESSGWKEKQEIVNLIRGFLGMPIQFPPAPRQQKLEQVPPHA